MVSRRIVLTAGVGVATSVAVAGCGSSGKARWQTAGSTSDEGAKPAASPTSAVRISTVPAAAATGVLPTEPVVINAEGGKLQTVAVSAGDKALEGAIDAEQRSWRSAGPLEFGKSYTVTVTAVDSKGIASQHTSTFETIKPTATSAVTFQANALVALKTGGTYGVGQPVIVGFSKPVTDHATAEKAMEVVTEPAVTGRWHWFGNQSAHWRPAKYWTPGTKIRVTVNAFGVNLGDGVYGAANASTNFTIGKSRIAIADGSTHHMLVYIDGAMVRDIPVSLGKDGSTKGADGSTIYFATNSGPHVVLGKESAVRMRSASFGITNPKDPNYYDETIKLCSRITYSGEYVHLADWNVAAHGNSNTSHGCINVGPANAQWFFDTFQVGDVVEVKNTARRLSATDGVGDWTISWDNW